MGWLESQNWLSDSIPQLERYVDQPAYVHTLQLRDYDKGHMLMYAGHNGSWLL